MRYKVKFVNDYYKPPRIIRFSANTKDDVKLLVASLCGHYSGDPYKCFINGKKEELFQDWGLENWGDK